MEDSLSCIHGSISNAEPASPHLRSELSIVAGIATATLPPNPKVPWDQWTGDYGKVRGAIEATYPEQFKDFNARMFTPGGFYKGQYRARARMEDRKRQGRVHRARDAQLDGISPMRRAAIA